MWEYRASGYNREVQAGCRGFIMWYCYSTPCFYQACRSSIDASWKEDEIHI